MRCSALVLEEVASISHITNKKQLYSFFAFFEKIIKVKKEGTRILVLCGYSIS